MHPFPFRRVFFLCVAEFACVAHMCKSVLRSLFGPSHNGTSITCLSLCLSFHHTTGVGSSPFSWYCCVSYQLVWPFVGSPHSAWPYCSRELPFSKSTVAMGNNTIPCLIFIMFLLPVSIGVAALALSVQRHAYAHIYHLFLTMPLACPPLLAMVLPLLVSSST